MGRAVTSRAKKKKICASLNGWRSVVQVTLYGAIAGGQIIPVSIYSLFVLQWGICTSFLIFKCYFVSRAIAAL